MDRCCNGIALIFWYCPPGKPCALTVVCTQGVGSLNLTYLSSRIQVLYLSMSRCLKVSRSLLSAKGLEEKFYKV